MPALEAEAPQACLPGDAGSKAGIKLPGLTDIIEEIRGDFSRKFWENKHE